MGMKKTEGWRDVEAGTMHRRELCCHSSCILVRGFQGYTVHEVASRTWLLRMWGLWYSDSQGAGAILPGNVWTRVAGGLCTHVACIITRAQLMLSRQWRRVGPSCSFNRLTQSCPSHVELVHLQYKEHIFKGIFQRILRGVNSKLK